MTNEDHPNIELPPPRNDPRRPDVSTVTADKSTHSLTPSEQNLAAATISDKLPSREEYLLKMQGIMDRHLAQKPELASDPAFTLQNYGKGIDLAYACRERLDANTNERLRLAMSQYSGQTPTPDGSDTFDMVSVEIRTLLEGHPDLQAQWNDIYGSRETWQNVYDTVQLGLQRKEVEPRES